MARFWDNIVRGVRARKGEFTGTSGFQSGIKKGNAVLRSLLKHLHFNY